MGKPVKFFKIQVEDAALRHEVEKVDDFRTITLVVRGGMVELHSTFHYHSKVRHLNYRPFCGWPEFECRVRASRLQAILREVGDPAHPLPCTLLLRDNSNFGPACLLVGYTVLRLPNEQIATPKRFSLENEQALDCC